MSKVERCPRQVEPWLDLVPNPSSQTLVWLEVPSFLQDPGGGTLGSTLYQTNWYCSQPNRVRAKTYVIMLNVQRSAVLRGLPQTSMCRVEEREAPRPQTSPSPAVTPSPPP